ncbi:MAG TPA: primosomal protein N', partial [Planctomycetes bacterium]|nr:primosomal protein N' [Planctomycetota bacterium]
DRKEQALLFLNRRGYHTTILCTGCEEPLTCRDCDIPMTFYKAPGHLLCHYCGRTSAPPARCPACGHTCIRFTGFGTELVEHAARSLFPHARVARMDSEAMKARDAHVDLFSKIRSREIDILVGTQMAAKGLDFPGITLIGVVAADTSLLIPDFRSAERTFQLVTQVAGRSGRGAKEGRVLVQTYSPDHYAYQAALGHDYEGFAEKELVHRREARYPPFGSLLRIVIQGEDEKAVRERSGVIAEALGMGAASLGITMLGPSPCPLSRIKRLFRYHIVFRADHGRDLEELIPRGERLLSSTKRIQVLIDRDPTSMM